MATLNIRIDKEMKLKLKESAARGKRKLSSVVKELLSERLLLDELPPSEDWQIPDWVPAGKYVALSRGAVAAVGNSPSEVLSEAITKFPDEPIQVKRKNAPVPRFEYAFLAEMGMKCWRYVQVGEEQYPIVPATIAGRRRVATAAAPDTAASISLATKELVRSAGLIFIGEREIFTGGGPIKLRIFQAGIELPVGCFTADLAAIDLPDEFPVRLLLGRNILDSLDTYILGKKRVLCIRDP